MLRYVVAGLLAGGIYWYRNKRSVNDNGNGPGKVVQHPSSKKYYQNMNKKTKEKNFTHKVK